MKYICSIIGLAATAQALDTMETVKLYKELRGKQRLRPIGRSEDYEDEMVNNEPQIWTSSPDFVDSNGAEKYTKFLRQNWNFN